ncbi:MAG: D-alanyl-D-alanine carboxypeptidase [Oscillospiraceae bacterium]|nr:D-alanyl-D-alanine carboxypeptidase [Oscillospiraceae bacterium]
MPATANAIEGFEIEAAAAVLMDAETGEVFFSKSAHVSLPPASTTKLMAVLIAVEAIEAGTVAPEDRVTASDRARFDLTFDSSTANIQPGEIMSLEDLLYCALVVSANEACNIIGEYISGDIESFVALMNRRAGELGCSDTNFANTHGLPNESHYTSAYDLALIAREALRHPTLVKIANTVKYTIPATNLSGERAIRTTNYLLREETPQYYYADAVGLKTGYTGAAGHCLVSSASKSGMSVVSVVLGAAAPEVEKGVFITESFTETRRMFQWFFANYGYKDILKSSELIDSVEVRLGKGADQVVIHPESGIRIILPNDVAPEEVFVRTVGYDAEGEPGSETVTAPVARGQRLGEITLTYNGKVYGPVPLVANSNVELDRWAYLADQAGKTLDKAWIKVTFGVVVLLFGLYLYLAARRSVRIRRLKRAQARKRPERVVYRDD